MHARRRTLLLLAVAAGAFAGLAGSSRAQPSSPGSAAKAAAPDVEVALLVTGPNDRRSELLFVHPARTLPKATLSFDHQPGGSLRAMVVPGSRTVLATAPSRAMRDASFDTGLYRLDGSSAELLTEGLIHAQRPLVSPTGRIFVTRGTAGPATPKALRLDELSVDEVELASGAVREVTRFAGFVSHLAGWHDGRVLLYRVAPGVSEVVAIDPDSGKERRLAGIAPFARDFSVDRVHGRLILRNRHETDPHAWVVDAIDLQSGKLARLHEEATFALAPHAWPDGGVALNPHGDGLVLLGSRDTVRRPFGAGVDWIRDISTDGRFVVALHSRAGAASLPFLVDRKTSHSHRLPVPAGRRVAVAGIVGASP